MVIKFDFVVITELNYSPTFVSYFDHGPTVRTLDLLDEYVSFSWDEYFSWKIRGELQIIVCVIDRRSVCSSATACPHKKFVCLVMVVWTSWYNKTMANPFTEKYCEDEDLFPTIKMKTEPDAAKDKSYRKSGGGKCAACCVKFCQCLFFVIEPFIEHKTI